MKDTKKTFFKCLRNSKFSQKENYEELQENLRKLLRTLKFKWYLGEILETSKTFVRNEIKIWRKFMKIIRWKFIRKLFQKFVGYLREV